MIDHVYLKIRTTFNIEGATSHSTKPKEKSIFKWHEFEDKFSIEKRVWRWIISWFNTKVKESFAVTKLRTTSL